MKVTGTIVVGSGPAGVAAARALVVRGKAVTMIDVGFTGADPASEPEPPPPGRLGRKLAAGSDHPYRPPRGRALAANDTALVASHARGGFSTVWGATMLPYDRADLDGWPLSPTDLQASYAEVATYVPIAASPDGLGHRHPLLGSEEPALRVTAAIRTVLDRLEPRSRRLARQRIELGHARLAVRAGRPAPAAGCAYCRRCLTGCPFDHVWSAEQTLAGLVRRPGFTYRAGLYVERVAEGDDGATVWCRDVASGAPRLFRAERVLLAAGAVGTTALLQRSGLIPERRTILDSGLTVVPMLLAARPGPPDEAAHTLAQLFARVDLGPDLPPATVQVYGPDPAVAERARALDPRLGRLPRPLVDQGLRLLLTAFIYLHSDVSDAIACRTTAEGTTLTRLVNPDRDLATARVIRRLLRGLGPSGLVPVGRFRTDLPAGQGFHAGGSIPMRRRPAPGTTDQLGRPWGMQRIHAVDASAFPTVPAGPITWSIMANATRIAAALADGRPAVTVGTATPGVHRPVRP